jgi:hypothetical protein
LGTKWRMLAKKVFNFSGGKKEKVKNLKFIS